MNAAIAWLAGNPVAANLLMGLMVVGGVAATTTLPEEIFPEVALDQIAIEVPYLGAAPEEVEEGVIVRIEQAVQGIDGVREIRSTASEGSASVIVEIEADADARRVIDEVKNNVDSIITFPVQTERPVIRELIGRNQVVDVAVWGAADLVVLKTIAERVHDDLTALPGISQARLVGAPPYEISIELSEAAMRRHGLTFDQVAEAVRRSSLDLPGGSLRTDAGEVLLRTVGQAYRGAEYASLVLLTRADGTRLRLGDVATVVDGFAETDQHARFDRAPTVMVSVYRTGDQSVLDVAAAVERYIERARAGLPEGVSLTVWRNEAQALNDRLVLLLRNAVTGFVLVFVLLALCLELRLAVWVSLGIPISFLGAIAFLPGLGVSINPISIFAFVLVLGIVVDDAIIVGENVHRHQEHAAPLPGAVGGATELAKPVVFSVLTTVVAFVPLLFVPGITGQVFRTVPLIAIPCLLVSLVESLGVLPAHLAHGRARRGAGGGLAALRRGLAGGLAWLTRAGYQPLLDVALRWRYVTASLGVGLLVVTAGVVLGGRVGLQFFPPIEPNYMTASITMPQGTPVDVTSTAIARLEQGVTRVRAELLQETGRDYFRHVATTVGDQPLASRDGGLLGPLLALAAPNVGEVTVELAAAETRAYTSAQLGARWRDATGPIPEAVEVSFTTSAFEVGDDIDVRLTGPELDDLRAAADTLKRRLADYGGVYSISDSFRGGKREVRLGIKPAAEMLGLTLQDLGRQVRQAFYGEEAQRIQRGRDDIRVMVRYPQAARRSLGDLENMRIRTGDGGEVPFGLVAELEPGRGFASIRRVGRDRAVNVTALVDTAVTSSGSVVADLRDRVLPELLAAHPGVDYAFEGVQAEQVEAFDGLARGGVIALFVIFALLAVPLRSYGQPLVIMAAIPFGAVGALWGHVVMGMDIALTSLLGLVALTGVVVNDSLVMVDFINRARDEPSSAGAGAAEAAGASERPAEAAASAALRRAIREAGGKRFRPILLTSLTTFAGLAPLMLERSMEAMFLVPMAVSLAFGVLFATFITLFLVPVACLILDDGRQAARRLASLGAAARRGRPA